MAGLLEGKVAIITGGASGIGLASVERFVAEGARVVFADIADAAGEAIAARLGDRAVYVHADVTDEAAIERLVATAVERFGKLDVMYNNAGASGDPSPIINLSSEGFDKTMALLARSVVLGHKYAASQFLKQGSGGSIISTSSGAGLQGGWSSAGYTIAKHAIVGIVRQAAAEFAPFGIRTNAIAPGIIITPLMASTFGFPEEDAEPFGKFLTARLDPKQPTGRCGRPDDVAKVATFFASDLSEFVTGVTLPVDGGVTSMTLGTFALDLITAAGDYANGATS